MTNLPDEFDDLYQDVRDDLLVEAYALTGDLSVSRTAVRDAFAVAWHQWPKVRKVGERVTWLRPHVWRRARVRHSVRPWHKEKNLPTEVADTLAALDELTLNQRKALVLTHLSPVPLAEAAREIGVTLPAAEELVVLAHTDFMAKRGATEAEVAPLLEGLREVATGRWPRSSIIRRAGTARRRTHTLAAVLGTVALVIASGTVLAQGSNDDAALDKQGFDRRPIKIDETDELPQLEKSALLVADQVTRVQPKLVWREAATHDNTDADGLALPCQQVRFADPEGQALVRTFAGSTAKALEAAQTSGEAAPAAATAVEMVEMSVTPEAAEAAYDTAFGWFAACSAPGTQLVRHAQVGGVGDEASLFTFRTWTPGTSTVQVALSRSGQVLTTTATRVDGWSASARPVSELIGAAVNAQCGNSGVGPCASPAQLKDAAAPVAGEVPGLLSEWDLPPVTGKPGPWAAASPVAATKNLAATACDRASFAGKEFSQSLTRTFTLPEAKRPDALGMTQSAGVMKDGPTAKKFVTKIARRVAACAEDAFGRDVVKLASSNARGVSLDAWQIEVAVSDDETVAFLMAIIRQGNVVSQIGFVPERDYRMNRDDFVWVAKRAQERLPRLELSSAG